MSSMRQVESSNNDPRTKPSVSIPKSEQEAVVDADFDNFAFKNIHLLSDVNIDYSKRRSSLSSNVRPQSAKSAKSSGGDTPVTPVNLHGHGRSQSHSFGKLFDGRSL
jgi:hypothetical protein